MIEPRVCRSAGSQACMTLKVPLTFTSSTRRQFSWARGLSMSSRMMIPALFTTTLTAPISRPTRSASAVHASASVTSSAKALASPPLERISCAVASAVSA